MSFQNKWSFLQYSYRLSIFRHIQSKGHILRLWSFVIFGCCHSIFYLRHSKSIQIAHLWEFQCIKDIRNFLMSWGAESWFLRLLFFPNLLTTLSSDFLKKKCRCIRKCKRMSQIIHFHMFTSCTVRVWFEVTELFNLIDAYTSKLLLAPWVSL